MLFGDVFMRKYPVIYDKMNNRMGFVGYLIYFIVKNLIFFRATPMGLLENEFLRAVLWIWLAIAILIIIIIIVLKILIYRIKKTQPRTSRTTQPLL